MTLSVFVVLLRAIGPATHKVMSMTRWRDAAAEAGFVGPETYLATGNMIVAAEATRSEVEKRMNLLVREMGLKENVVAVVRTPSALRRVVAADPFPEAARIRPSRVGVYFFSRARPDFSWLDAHDGPEPIHVEGSHLVVDYGDGENARLAGLIEKRSGTVTARNWSTTAGLLARAQARGTKAG